MRRKPHKSASGLILKEQQRKRHAKQAHISANEKIKAERKVQSFANKAIFYQATKKTKTPTKKIKLRLACGLEKDVPGSGKREAVKQVKNPVTKEQIRLHRQTEVFRYKKDSTKQLFWVLSFISFAGLQQTAKKLTVAFGQECAKTQEICSVHSETVRQLPLLELRFTLSGCHRS